jgi:microcin-processing metallopeptidase PmbA/TldD-like protein
MTRCSRIAAWCTLAAAALGAGAPSSARAQAGDDVLGRALRDELARSMTKLRITELDRPYFIAYRITDVEMLEAAASFGSVTGSNQNRTRLLTVELRVGDYTFDNTNFFSMPNAAMGIALFGMRGAPANLPLDDDYLEIRRQIWLATDAAYKQAVQALADKRAAHLNHTSADSLPDFSHEDTTHTTDESAPLSMTLAGADSLVSDLSKSPALAGLYASSVALRVRYVRSRYLNSEGTTFTVAHPLFAFMLDGSTQAPDGTPLGSAVTVFATTANGIPTRAALAAQVRGFGLQLDSLRTAPRFDRYSGPVLFERHAAAELFSEMFAPALLARRRMEFGNSQMDAMFQRMAGVMGGSFTNRLGARVLPEFLSVVDDPTTSAYGTSPLLAHYLVDDEGVRARRTRLIEGGVLKALLATRTPVQGALRSTGNTRGAVAAPSNLIVEAKDAVADSTLKNQLLALVRKRGLAYGIVIRELGTGSVTNPQAMMMAMMSAMMGQDTRGRSVLRAYKVFPDGHEEGVRGAQLVGVTTASFKDIVAVSNAPTVYDADPLLTRGLPMLAGLTDTGLAAPASSYVVPSLLFDDLTLTQPPETSPKPPFSDPPPLGR